jgi:hypothetical protein
MSEVPQSLGIGSMACGRAMAGFKLTASLSVMAAQAMPAKAKGPSRQQGSLVGMGMWESAYLSYRGGCGTVESLLGQPTPTTPRAQHNILKPCRKAAANQFKFISGTSRIA